LQPLGEGGMGAVWMAEQTEPVQRRVALKLIKPGLDSKQILARFEAERQALALMDHPNVARVFDVGSTANGRPYFVMELVKGVPVTRYCDERRLTVRQRLELFVPVCQAVQHAHQKGVIHRDLKPSNVLVALYDGKPVPKVIDFGVAKATGPKLTERTLFTEFGSIVGTLEYMSPEQAELNQLDIDTRSDVYSLGVVLYELLTGTTPLQRDRLPEVGVLELLRRIREEEPPRPSTRLSTTEELPAIAASRGLEPRKLAGLVRGELDWIVMRALEKDRNRRYESAHAFAADVQRYLADEPVHACPPSAAYRLRKLLRRHKGPALVGLALFLMLVVLLVVLLVSYWQIAAAFAGQKQANDNLEKANRNEKQSAEAAKKKEQEARQTAYYRTTSLAHHEWRDNHLTRARAILRDCDEDLRGWEWYYLSRLCEGDGQWLPTGGEIDRGLALSPDGSRLAHAVGNHVKPPADSGGVVYHVTVWDLPSDREVFTIAGLKAEPWGMAFRRGGDQLAVSLQDQTIQVWDLVKREAVFTLPAPGNLSARVLYSGNGQRLVAVSGGLRRRDPAAVRVWDAATGKELASFAGGVPTPNYGVAAAVSFDGNRVALGAQGGAVVYEAATGRKLQEPRRLDGFLEWYNSLAFTEGGGWLVATGLDGTVHLWDLNGAPRDLGQVRMAGQTVALSPNGEHLATTGEQGILTLWEATTGKQEQRIHTEFGSAVFSGDGRRLATVSGRGVTVWDVSRQREAQVTRLPRAVIRGGASLSSDGRRFASVGDAGSLLLWDLTEAAPTKPFRTLRSAAAGERPPDVTCTAFSPDGQRLAAALPDGTVRLWDVSTGEELLRLPGHEGGASWVAFSPAGRLVTADRAGLVKVWDPAGRELRALGPFAVEVEWPAPPSPDGPKSPAGPPPRSVIAPGLRLVNERLVAVPGGQRVQVWDLDTGRQVADFQGSPHLQGLHVAVCSPDGNFVAAARSTISGESPTEVQLWEAATGRELLPLRGNLQAVTGLTFSPDSRRLVSTGQDGSLRLWELTSGLELLTLQVPGGPVGEWSPMLGFSADDDRILLAGNEGVVCSWDGTPLKPPPTPAAGP
jgi:WD40 repeat protein/tRNA A-37 threonylcarbamoyl transferase component Bud32